MIFGIGLIFGLNIIKVKSLTKKNYHPFFDGKIENFCINEVCVNQDNGQWKVKDGQKTAPANQEMVNIYLQKWQNIYLEETASINKNNFSNLGIGSSRVILSINDKKLEIGNINSRYEATFVKPDNEEKIYLTSIVFDKNELSKFDYWMNKTLTNLATVQTTKITIVNNGKSISVEPKEGVWKNQEWVEKVNHLTTNNYLENFLPSDPKTKINIENEISQVEINLGEKINENKKTIYWATIDNINYYEISKEDYILLTAGKY